MVQEFHRKGCDHNINFGMEFAKQFLDLQDDSNDILSTTRSHNNRVGRLVSY